MRPERRDSEVIERTQKLVRYVPKPRVEAPPVEPVVETRPERPASTMPRFEFTHERVAWLQAKRAEKKRARMERMQAERAPVLARIEERRALRAKVRMRYEAGETQEAIARDIGVSRARVGQMLAEERAEREGTEKR